jgi:tetratricopeptide (TPR) repeat protein
MQFAACVSTTTTQLYRGEMELVAVSGDACTENETANARIQLEIVLEQNSSNNGQQITGYISGPEIQTGILSGNNVTQLLVAYPDESDSIARGHTLLLTSTTDGMSGELHEKPQGTLSGCYFENAVLRLKHAAVEGKAKAAFDRQRKLFIADEFFNRGQAQMKANNPEEALRNFTESQRLRCEEGPNEPNRSYQIFSIATAHMMAGREGNALAILRNLFKEKQVTGLEHLAANFDVIRSLCAFTYEAKEDVRQKAAEQLLDDMARDYGGHNDAGEIFAECYHELGQDRIDQEDPDQSIEYFKKALALNPNDADSIAGVIIGSIAKETPAEGRQFLQEHARTVIAKTGKEAYNNALANLYTAEAIQAEKVSDYTRAEHLLREALIISPEERAIIFNLASVLEKMEKPDEARKLLETASTGCRNETCRLEYSDLLARQKQIESIVKRIRAEPLSSGLEK